LLLPCPGSSLYVGQDGVSTVPRGESTAHRSGCTTTPEPSASSAKRAADRRGRIRQKSRILRQERHRFARLIDPSPETARPDSCKSPRTAARHTITARAVKSASAALDTPQSGSVEVGARAVRSRRVICSLWRVPVCCDCGCGVGGADGVAGCAAGGPGLVVDDAARLRVHPGCAASAKGWGP
jgi:hypothetical protein